MKRLLGLKVILNLTLIVMIIGGIVYTLGFGICLYIARQEVTAETNKKVERDIDYVQTYIDGQLQRIEDATYSLASRNFGNTTRDEEGNSYVSIDQNNFYIPSEEECYTIMRQFMDANPMVCGIAIGFENFLYPESKAQYGMAPYLNRISGEYTKMNLGEHNNFREKEWYKVAAETNKPHWCNPFPETSSNHVITCYSVPVHGLGGRLIGVLAVDIDTETFSHKCKEIAPYPNAVVTLVDRKFNIIFHPNTSYITKNVADIQHYAHFKADDSLEICMRNGESGHTNINEGTDKEALFYFAPVERTGWMISVECPKDEVFGGLEQMKRDTTIIAVCSILVMIICFIFLLRKMQEMTLSKANMESELNVASRIQKGMVPKLYPAFPDRPELDVYGFLEPAKSVGGDLYDYFVQGDKLYFCIGDVSGKGIPASLYMAVTRALFRNVSLHNDDPSTIISDLNNALSQGNDHNMFCTMFLGVLDLKTGHLEYCNAGHNAPVVRRKKSDGTTDTHYTKPQVNIALGVIEEFPYQKEETTLNPGDAIFLYTDGVTEAENEYHQLFGEEATLKALAHARSQNISSAKGIIESVHGAIKQYAHNTEQSDDITMVVIELKALKCQ